MSNKVKEQLKAIKNSKLISPILDFYNLGENAKYTPAALAFYLIVSLVPIITIISYILSFLGYDITYIFNYISEIYNIDKNVYNELLNIYNQTSGSFHFSFGISYFVLLYLSSKGTHFFIYAYRKIMNETKVEKSAFLIWVRSIFFSLLIEIILAFFVVFLILFEKVVIVSSKALSLILKLGSLLLFLFLFFSFFYLISSTKKITIKRMWKGALLSSLSIGIGIFFYVYYLTNISHFLSYFGPLSSLFFLILIIYYISYCSMVGIYANKKWYKENPHTTNK